MKFKFNIGNFELKAHGNSVEVKDASIEVEMETSELLEVVAAEKDLALKLIDILKDINK